MKRYVRLDQADLELAINNELRRVGCKMNGPGGWKIIKAENTSESDAIAFECEVKNLDEEDEEEQQQKIKM